MKAKYELTEAQVNNLLLFLDRVNYTGLKEVQAINELIYIFANPIRDGVDETKKDK